MQKPCPSSYVVWVRFCMLFFKRGSSRSSPKRVKRGSHNVEEQIRRQWQNAMQSPGEVEHSIHSNDHTLYILRLWCMGRACRVTLLVEVLQLHVLHGESITDQASPRTPTQRTFQPQEAVQPQRNQTILQADTPAQKANTPTNGHTPRRLKPTHTRLTYTRMRPHAAPSHQAGDHPVPAHTERHFRGTSGVLTRDAVLRPDQGCDRKPVMAGRRCRFADGECLSDRR